jgi:hypothetical protein
MTSLINHYHHNHHHHHQHQHGMGGMNNFSGGALGINLNEAPQVDKDYTSLFVLMLHFTGIIHLLVGLTYYYQYLNTLEDGPSSLRDMTDSEMFLFLGIIQIGHDIRDIE